MATLSVVVPALNEEGNLGPTVDTIRAALADRFDDYEILIVDDGSTDRTGAVADDLAARDARVRAFHNPRNMGFGYNYSRGVELAQMQYLALVPGDNEISGESIAAIFARVGQADIVAPYTVNAEVRPRLRRVLSRLYTRAINLLFGLNLKYFNGPAVHRIDLLRTTPITTFGFAFLAELMVRLIRSGHNYVEVGMWLLPRSYGRSTALRLNNALSVFKTVLGLWWSVHVQERARYAQRGRAV